MADADWAAKFGTQCRCQRPAGERQRGQPGVHQEGRKRNMHASKMASLVLFLLRVRLEGKVNHHDGGFFLDDPMSITMPNGNAVEVLP